MTIFDELPRMSPEDFRDHGYLLEANRQFFHPLGLALAVDGDRYVILDDRQDPEGWVFGDLSAPGNQEKIARVEAEVGARRPVREETLGFWVQPPRGL